MQTVFNDMECDPQVADTSFVRREPDSVGHKRTSESTGNADVIDTASVHDDFLHLRAVASAIWNDFLMFWWDARLCHHEFRFNFLAQLCKKTKWTGRGATNYLKKTE